MENYDIVVVGGGPAGYVGAMKAAGRGVSVALVERGPLGGVCLNVGCIPTKALLDLCHTLHRVESLCAKGVVSGSVEVDLGAAVDAKDAQVAKLRGGIEQLLRARGVIIINGTARITAPGEMEIEGADGIGYGKVVIASGSKPIEIPSLPFDGETVLSSADVLSLREVPQSMLIVGGGYIGCEFADLFARFGSKVIVAEMLPGILPGSDKDLARAVGSGLESAGVEFLLETKAEAVTKSGDGVGVELSSGESRQVSKVLVAVGRVPAMDVGDLAALGVTVDGGIEIDDRCATSAGNIYAAGDVTMKRMLAHVASRQGEVAVENALGEDVEIDYSTVPEVVFTSPEIASVGMTEAAAREEGIEIRTAKFPYAALGRAVVTGDDNGFVKIVGGEDNGVLGVQIAGRGASEMIAIGGLAVQVGATMDDLSEMIITHPTFSEALREAADVWLGKAVHVMK